MDENTSVEMRTENQPDAFLEAYGVESPAEEQPANQQEEQSAGEAEQPGSTTEQEAEQAEEAAQQVQEAPAEQAWSIKVNTESRVIRSSDITPELLQKAYDYDRIRQRYDESKPIMRMMRDFAQAAGMSVSDYATYLRTETKKASGMNDEDAKRSVELEDREAAVSEKERAAKAEADAKEAAARKVEQDVNDFAKAFPDIYEQAKKDKGVIPKEVWDEVSAGMSLTAAYARHMVATAAKAAKTAQVKADSEVQNVKNSARSTGSMRSAGNDAKLTDDFLDAYLNG